MKHWNDILKADNPAILAWAETRDWAQRMAACGQDSGWHAEGDVWTHTRMVFEEVAKLAEYPELDRVDQLKLLFAALFHDSGKTDTTVLDEETQRIRSPKHALVGANLCRRVLRELEAPFDVRESIVALARFHGRPPYLMEKEDPAREVIDLSWRVDNRALYLFALADTRGRKTAVTGRAEDDLHLWRLQCEEQDCFESPFPFANDHARFLFYRGRLSSLHYAPQEEFSCTVTLMAGLPGAGKNHWLAANRPDLPVVALDDLRERMGVDPADNQGVVIQAAKEECRKHLRAGRGFAFNATNTIRNTRRKWVDLFADYGARIEIVCIEPSLRTVLAQNRERENPVPERVIQKLADNLEPPDWTEAHGVEWATNSG